MISEFEENIQTIEESRMIRVRFPAVLNDQCYNGIILLVNLNYLELSRYLDLLSC